ncbi:unnamed protein product [Lampetra planeri]
MDTRGTTRTRESEMEDTSAESAPEMAEVGSKQPGPSTPAPLRQEGRDASAEGLRLAHSRLAELLYAAAATLEEITRLGAGGAARDDDGSRRAAPFPATPTRLAVKFPAITTVGAEGGASPRQVTAEGQAQAVTSSTPASASTTERPAMPCSQPAHTVTSAGNDGARSTTTDVALQQRLPPLKEFVGADGDWGGFKRRFLAHQQMANWTDGEALRALPAMLDNDALATLTSAPKEKRATLHLALKLLSAVYGPPSDCRQLFHDRQRGATGRLSWPWRRQLFRGWMRRGWTLWWRKSCCYSRMSWTSPSWLKTTQRCLPCWSRATSTGACGPCVARLPKG